MQRLTLNMLISNPIALFPCHGVHIIILSLDWNKKNEAAVNKEGKGVDVAWMLDMIDAEKPLLLLTAGRGEAGKKTYAHVVSSIDEKCAACNAIAERPRNHLDMRHRLDSKGQRKGKVIDYRVSELRVVKLLDGLCDKMEDYTLEKVITRKDMNLVRVDSWDNLSENGIGTPKEFLILAFLGFGITPFSLVNWPTLLVVMLMVGSNSAYCKLPDSSLIICINAGCQSCSHLFANVSFIYLCSDSHEVDADDDEPDGEL
ncbi:hypothetical protein POTOM_009222 [Populus tomentosa]|uniref:DUF3456 domain-containing protein n=1 Tax=Populus tomentosa TaxID=118781 RepID=A0A8X8AB23_POPTO|nr:hypothetical protein POTOM_009222 [Populus tomentosa]